MISCFKFRQSERGLALIYALLLLALGAVITVPLLSFMNTGLVAAQVYEKETQEIYAADAGIQDAVWKINNCRLVGTEGIKFTFNYKDTGGVLHEDFPGYLPPSDPDILNVLYPIYYYIEGDSGAVNGYDVMVSIEYLEQNIFEVVSTQYDPDIYSSAVITPVFVENNPSEFTSITAWISTIYGDYSGIGQNALTSLGPYTIQGGQGSTDPAEGEEHGPVDYYGGAWPTAEVIKSFYGLDVEDLVSYNSSSLDVKDFSELGPFYRDGGLTINSSQKNAVMKLTGTVYITGYTEIGQTGQDFILDLNGQTIFIESDIAGNQYALRIGGKCTIIGSGCIIAIGSIEMKPNMQTDEDDYILTLSVSGKTYMQPNGDYYGTLAGETSVYLQNGSVTWNDPSLIEVGLNFPSSSDSKNIFGILSYIIS